mmetsp:Transcript_19083/g.17313  ORF Transcript_19083/g.17313 Transcript_19083/m.17313 type:complete len:474 (+) Transcript_19083:170-1591(+)
MEEIKSEYRSVDISTHSNLTSGKGEYNNYLHFISPKTIEEIINNPIELGFLCAFCESQYSSENVRFVIEVGRFVDSIKRDSTLCKNKLHYKEIDRLTNLSEVDITSLVVPHKGKEVDFGKINEWSSTIVPRSTVIENVISIFDEFISTNAERQICLSTSIIVNTLHRIKNMHLYTFQIFDEALLDPIKTLRKDVLPRFLHSEHYKRLVSHCSHIYPLPSLKEFTFQMPSTAKVLQWPDEKLTLENLRNVDWYVLLHDYILFGQFLKYTQSIVSSENLLCARLSAKYMCLWEAKGYPMKQNTFISLNCSGQPTYIEPSIKSVDIQTQLPDIQSQLPDIPTASSSSNTTRVPSRDKMLFSKKTGNPVKVMTCPPDAQELAWSILRYFILPNSVYEISLSHRKRKDIMESLANPDYHLFDKVVKSVIGALRGNYDSYIRSDYFKNLITVIKTEKEKIAMEKKIEDKKFNSCLPMFR